jgi:hypothetical protein
MGGSRRSLHHEGWGTTLFDIFGCWGSHHVDEGEIRVPLEHNPEDEGSVISEGGTRIEAPATEATLPADGEHISPPRVPAPVPGERSRSTRIGHGDDDYDVFVSDQELRGPRFISGCASVWAKVGDQRVYAHCSRGFTSLAKAVDQADKRPGDVTSIRMTRPRNPMGAEAGEREARGDREALQALFPRAQITRWTVDDGVLTYFDKNGNPFSG